MHNASLKKGAGGLQLTRKNNNYLPYGNFFLDEQKNKFLKVSI